VGGPLQGLAPFALGSCRKAVWVHLCLQLTIRLIQMAKINVECDGKAEQLEVVLVEIEHLAISGQRSASPVWLKTDR